MQVVFLLPFWYSFGGKAALVNEFNFNDVQSKIKNNSKIEVQVFGVMPERQKLDHLLQVTVCATAGLADCIRRGNRGKYWRKKLQLIVID